MSPPLVTVRPASTDDTGPRHVVVIAGLDGPDFATPALAELYASQLTAALAPLAAIAARVDALLASPDMRDAVAGRCAAPTSAALAVLRWVRSGGDAGSEGGEALRWRDDPAGLDRLITAAGAAIVCGEEGSTDGE